VVEKRRPSHTESLVTKLPNVCLGKPGYKTKLLFKKFSLDFFWQEKFEFETTQVIKVNKLLWFGQVTITTPTHGLQRIKGLYFFPSYACSSLFSHLVSKPRINYMIECQIVFKKLFHWIFFCKKRSACIASFPMQKKKCLEFGHLVQL